MRYYYGKQLIILETLNKKVKTALRCEAQCAVISNLQLFIQQIRLSSLQSYNCMRANNIFTQTISSFKNNTPIQDLVIDFKDQVRLKVLRGMTLQPQNLIRKFNQLQKRYDRTNSQRNQTQWLQNERKLFLWFTLAYCRLHFKKISEITQKEWNEISSCFRDKNILHMKYEARSLEKNSERVHWQSNEEKLLEQCVRSQLNGKWAQISRSLYFGSDGEYFKTAKQCREHWFNHLDRAIKKGEWTVDEDLLILNFVKKEGRHWSRIIDQLGNQRTEHMAKNRFSSLLNCARKLLGSKGEEDDQNKLITYIVKQLQSTQASFEPSFSSNLHQQNNPISHNSQQLQALLCSSNQNYCNGQKTEAKNEKIQVKRKNSGQVKQNHTVKLPIQELTETIPVFSSTHELTANSDPPSIYNNNQPTSYEYSYLFLSVPQPLIYGLSSSSYTVMLPSIVDPSTMSHHSQMNGLQTIISYDSSEPFYLLDSYCNRPNLME